MVEIPDTLRCLFSARLEQGDSGLRFEVPHEEVEREAVTSDATYRVAVFAQPLETTTQPTARRSQSQSSDCRDQLDAQKPPVDEGEVRDVTIETLGDQGDGIARVERGYVLMIPDVQPGHEVTVEIEHVQDTVAFAQVIDGESRSL